MKRQGVVLFFCEKEEKRLLAESITLTIHYALCKSFQHKMTFIYYSGFPNDLVFLWQKWTYAIFYEFAIIDIYAVIY